MTARRAGIVLSLLLGTSARAAEPSLAGEIAAIRAIDDHTHAARVLSPAEPDDPESDALECAPDGSPPARLAGATPPMIQAWRKVYGYAYQDGSHRAEIPALRERAWAARGAGFPAWVLDTVGTEVAFANRVAMGPGLTAPRFRWVPFVDALVFPLDTRRLRINPDRAAFFASEARLGERYRGALGLRQLPLTLDGYLRDLLVPTLSRFKREGVAALKLELAYLRSLDVGPGPRDVAARTYARFVHGGTPDDAAYRALQDFLIRVIAREAGRLELPLQLHTGGGCGGFFDLAGSAPRLLSALVNDPALRATRFVLLHGGGAAYSGEAAALIVKSNVWTDFSALTFLSSPRTLAEILRNWLELAPEKVLFGSDYGPMGPGSDGAEIAALAAATAREALTRALDMMVADGELTRARALEIATLVLRGTAIKLYRL